MTLKKEYLQFLQSVFRQYRSISRVRLFGSYALGNATTRSDIDIAYEGALTDDEHAKIWTTLRYDAPFLMRCDLVAYDTAPDHLRAHIDRVGVQIV